MCVCVLSIIHMVQQNFIKLKYINLHLLLDKGIFKGCIGYKLWTFESYRYGFRATLCFFIVINGLI